MGEFVGKSLPSDAEAAPDDAMQSVENASRELAEQVKQKIDQDQDFLGQLLLNPDEALKDAGLLEQKKQLEGFGEEESDEEVEGHRYFRRSYYYKIYGTWYHYR